MSADSGHAGHHPQPKNGKQLALLALGALGIVYGDIGTSPLYALKEAYTGHWSVAPTHDHILGVMSLIFWAINFVVSFKYIGFVLRADNKGEGGILALLALIRPRTGATRGHVALLALGLFGAALLYGDGVITPAISVLGAVEGLTVKQAAPWLEPYVLWIAVAIIGGLFWVQSHGTEKVGRIFGPVTAIWFISIALLGIRGILMNPGVLAAANPLYAVRFFVHDGATALLVLSAVVLTITGGEALYADMGHFGRRPIRLAWWGLVLPSLLLNYFGQSALLLADPTAANNPFYNLVPGPLLYPMIAIATAAACIASQALISGAFSLTQQAVQLGFSPRVTIVHTSSTARGQIYIPEVNKALGVACVLLVLSFRSSTNLAGAYGIAVTGTMLVTSLLFYRVAIDRFHWARWKAALLLGVFLVVDVAFLVANLPKVPMGGWFPLAAAAAVYLLMTTWKKGRARLAQINRDVSLPLPAFIADIGQKPPVRVPGVAVFLTSGPGMAPPVLLHHLKHNKVLHQKVIMLSVLTRDVPFVDEDERLECHELGQGFWQVIVRTGFMETPDIPAVLRRLDDADIKESPGTVGVMQTSFFLGRETLLPMVRKKGKRLPPEARFMSTWRKKLFIVMTRNARSATHFFGLPPNRVVELGAQIQI